jgi:hypothetical protein
MLFPLLPTAVLNRRAEDVNISNTHTMASYTPYAIQHINLSVPEGTLHLAEEFYGIVIGFPSDPVPQLQRDTLRW